MSNKSGTSSQIISLPKGGGALKGIGEKFSPDLQTGTGNFTIPIALPPGRSGFQPQLNLVYSSGNGNGPFGLGWSLSVPGISRKTSKGIPKYADNSRDPKEQDTFILSGAEDLILVREEKGTGLYNDETYHYYRPRTEGLFARIKHISGNGKNYWEINSKDGLVSFYGTSGTAGSDPAVVADPDPSKRAKIFSWKLVQTVDLFGNRIEYEYLRDLHKDGSHYWDQLYLRRIQYADYPIDGKTKFLVSVTFEYEDRPDSFSDYRPGFEIRTTKRCKCIEIRAHAEEESLVRTYQLVYLDQREGMEQLLPLNRVSLLSQIRVIGHNGNIAEELPPLEFDYTRFQPEKRNFFPITGHAPLVSLGRSDYELVDLFGNGLPDVLEMNGTVRYWRNLGDGSFDLPREMQMAPAGLRLSDKGVQLIDANGDGRVDLLVTTESLAGYYPLCFGGLWDRRSFQRYKQAPSFDLKDPEVKLVDLDGDGVTDAIHSGSRFECFFNDPKEGWNGTRLIERSSLDGLSFINFSDSRVKWADMTGDGMQDVVLIHDGNVEYWPNLGYGSWGNRISMRNCPRFPYGYNPKRILIGDVDGDGLADIVYVDNTKVTLWINQSGNSWSKPIVIQGTPSVSDMDGVRLVDMLGTGISGILWSKDADGPSRANMFFLDFTGKIKPYLLREMNNHMGTVTCVEYAPSTKFYIEDGKRLGTRWKTPLPFPVQVVARVEAIDEISHGKLTTEYRYHHGYWDGAEREFRGFGMVEQLDTEVFEDYNKPGSHGVNAIFAKLEDKVQFSPPILAKTWFHQGPIGDEFGEWEETDFTSEFWSGDTLKLTRPQVVTDFLKNLPRRIKRDALRALRGSILRTELYALDGTDRQNRPYTVTEHLYGVCGVMDESGQPRLIYNINDMPPDWKTDDTHQRIFFSHSIAQRTTQWERGDDPMTQFTFIEDYDNYGQPRHQTAVALPRRAARRQDSSSTTGINETRILATHTRTEYAIPDPAFYIHDRTSQVRTFELINPPGVIETEPADLIHVLQDQAAVAQAICQRFHALLDLWKPGETLPAEVRLISHTINHYDGSSSQAFIGRTAGEVGPYGAITRSESLAFTDAELNAAYGNRRPSYLSGSEAPPAGSPPAFGNNIGYRLEHRSANGYHDGYYIDTQRKKFDFHDSTLSQKLGLVVAAQDALGHESTIKPDKYWLLPIEVTDPIGLKTKADYDYRVLQPKEVTDPNGNHITFTFMPLGLLANTAVRGKPGKNEGDQARASMQMVYDFLAFERSSPDKRMPIYIRTLRYTHHDTETDVPLPERDGTIETVEYSDGFGRLLQTRTQAEEVLFDNPALENPVFGDACLPADQTIIPGSAVGKAQSSADLPNVVVSGWQKYDNKGQVIEKYEPFFSKGWDYAQPKDYQLGQKVTMFYDPRGQVVRTVNPNGSEQRVIYGVPSDLTMPEQFVPTPWEVYTYDLNDNAGRTPNADPRAKNYEYHWNTPASTLVDALGHTLVAVGRNRARNNPGEALKPIVEYSTRSTYDIQGNLLTVTDALGRKAFEHRYDLMKRPLRIESIDAGIRLTVLDALGNPIAQIDSKGAIILRTYDNLNRPVRVWAQDGAGQKLTLRERLDYGDSPDSGLKQEQASAANLLGKLYRHYDEAGMQVIQAYDFKGNVLEKVRQVISDEKILSVFDGAAAKNWQVQAYRIDWQPQGTQELEAYAREMLGKNLYQISFTYDALNRVKMMQYPQDADFPKTGKRKTLKPHYNRAGALECVELDGTVYVEHIAYNAKGQRILIAYGNGVMTRYAYDPKTFRLVRMRTERYKKS